MIKECKSNKASKSEFHNHYSSKKWKKLFDVFFAAPFLKSSIENKDFTVWKTKQFALLHTFELKCSQYKSDAIQLKTLLDFEIAAFFRHLHGEVKKTAISNLRSFSTE